MDRLGLGYEALSAINPRLIYCAISGFGMTGPLRDRPSFDIVLQAMSGALSVNGEPGRPPTKLGHSAGRPGRRDQRPDRHPRGAARAQRHRPRTLDRRQPARRADRHARLSARSWRFSPARIRSPRDRSIPTWCPTACFPRRTGSIVIACLTNSFWERICRALGMDGLDRRIRRFDTHREAARQSRGW